MRPGILRDADRLTAFLPSHGRSPSSMTPPVPASIPAATTTLLRISLTCMTMSRIPKHLPLLMSRLKMVRAYSTTVWATGSSIKKGRRCSSANTAESNGLPAARTKRPGDMETAPGPRKSTYPDIKDLPMRFLTIPGGSASATHS